MKLTLYPRYRHTYASPPASGTPAELTVHDIVSRCKKLENLTFSISADMMLKPIASDTQNNLDCAYILRVTEHPTLRQVVLNCHRGHKFYDQYKPPPTDDFEPFVKAFQQGTNLLGRNIEVKVDFSPGIDIATMGLETMRQYKNGFTWAVTMDWFG
ncbi:hypothetical protein DM02DRAFT_55957 [Periconia macrospinosa]|uniref:Uncharacterized protein n=1 Tax=Periconia macrospinosa TaxID=97972 RepID=A0A2V1E8K5_9PLEO|nr:hypothetical protein DM02DRAFT_55957 [Periconia macrospinosa]